MAIMEILQVKQLSFAYPDEQHQVLTDINFTVQAGDFVVLCGASGCGKTTLLRQLKPELTPVGTTHGTILYNDHLLHTLPAYQSAQEIGMVFQNPDNSIVMDVVWHELSFGMENLGYSLPTMRGRLAEIAQFFGLEPLLYKHIHELSGGQKQLLNLASVLLLQPKLLLLDEPTSQLDPVAAREFISMVYRLNQEFSTTVIISEHRLEEVIPLADQMLLLEQGKLKYSGSPRQVSQQINISKHMKVNEHIQLEEQMHPDKQKQTGESIPRNHLDHSNLHNLDHLKSNDFKYLPSVTQLFWSMQSEQANTNQSIADQSIPLTVREGKKWLQTFDWNRSSINPSAMDSSNDSSQAKASTHQDKQSTYSNVPNVLLSKENILLECCEVTFQYEKKSAEVLKKLDLQIFKGEMLAILGGNGAGKSTLLQLLAGLLKPRRGSIIQANTLNIGYLAQNPLLYFSHDSVGEELLTAATYACVAEPEIAIAKLIQQLQLEGLEHKHPHDISGGQQQKTALAIVLLLNPDILLLDEPTKGLDPLAKVKLAELLYSLRQAGHTIVIVTHDVEFAAMYASRCAMLFDGMITATGSPSTFFSENMFYTTAVNRVVRDWLPGILTAEEVLNLWRVPASGS